MTSPTETGTSAGQPALNDWGKLAVFLTIVIGVTLLAALRIIVGELALGVYLTIIGYVTGNGVLARRRQAPSTLLAPRIDPAPPDEGS